MKPQKRFKVNTSGKTKGIKHRWHILSSFLCIAVYEIAEIFIENLIINSISYFILKILSTLLAVAGIHTIRVLLKTLITKIIYKEGTDKMDKIKAFFKWIFANKKSLGSTIIGAVGAGAGITASWSLESLPQIMVDNFNIAPILYTAICVVCFILNEIGVCGKGFEAVKTFIERKQVENEASEAKAIEKAAEKQIKADEKEKLAVEKEAEKQIKADEKAKEEADYAAKVEAKKAELLAQKEK